MPNGHSGGFLIAKTQLEELLKGFANDTVLGRALSEPVGDVSAATVMTMISTCRGKRIWVEEQDQTFFVLHLDYAVHENLEPQAEKWVMVGPDSPLFGPLKGHRGPLRLLTQRLVDWLRGGT